MATQNKSYNQLKQVFSNFRHYINMIQMKSHSLFDQKNINLSIITILIFISISSCTKKRQAELPEEINGEIFAISEFGQPDKNSTFKITLDEIQQSRNSSKKQEQISSLSEGQIELTQVKTSSLPSKYSFLFEDLQLQKTDSQEYSITFTVDKKYLTVYKIVSQKNHMTDIEKYIALTYKELIALQSSNKNSSLTLEALNTIQLQSIKSKADQLNKPQETQNLNEPLFVPIFKFNILEYGTLDRIKNSNNEKTATLRLKSTNYSEATHIRLSAKKDSRIQIALTPNSQKQLLNVFNIHDLENKYFSAAQLSEKLKLNLQFLNQNEQIQVKFDDKKMLIFKKTTFQKLSEDQKRLYITQTSDGSLIKCKESKDCVLELIAETAVSYKKPELETVDLRGSQSSDISLKTTSLTKDISFVEIIENTYVQQLINETSHIDPENTLELSDIKGDFYYRRTFEDAPFTFLGLTGTSGDLILVNFELEKNRLVVRNKMSLIQYSGLGPKDREEILSFPVKYFKIENKRNDGTNKIKSDLIETSLNSATHLKINWTKNQLLNTTSPLAFFSIGRCFIAEADQKVSNMYMGLKNKPAMLNFSLNYSYSVNPKCAYIKESNSYATSSSLDVQLNFNVKERISFLKKSANENEEQLSLNISNTAQKAFNFGVFTLADYKPSLNSIQNRDGSEIYKPMIYDFRHGKKMIWTIGGLNQTKKTDPERYKMIIEAIDKNFIYWNEALHKAFKGTTLARTENYLSYEIENDNSKSRLGDINKNYLWFQDLPAENGNLGVAQPAANPKTGTIVSSNIIMQTGNMFEYQKKLLKMYALARENEKYINAIKEKTLKNENLNLTQMMKSGSNGSPSSTSNNSTETNSAQKKISQLKFEENILNKNLSLNQNNQVSDLINKFKKEVNLTQTSKKVNSFEIDSILKSQSQMNKELKDAFLQESIIEKVLKQNNYDITSDEIKNIVFEEILNKSQISNSIKNQLETSQFKSKLKNEFITSTLTRPGCFTQITEADEDLALSLDSDPVKNLYLNFRKEILSTLTHEMGHALGLTHNFMGSFDKKNYQFDDEDLSTNPQKEKNYSSVMDYMTSAHLKDGGIGTYDVHSIRAAYTGFVELNSDTNLTQETSVLISKIKSERKLKVPSENLVHIQDLLKSLNMDSMVHFERDTLNKYSILKHYYQCNDMDTYFDVLCQRYDNGSTIVDIVKNKITNIERRYFRSYFVHDKINFSYLEKYSNIVNIIYEYADLRKYLLGFFNVIVYGSNYKYNENQETELKDDYFKAVGLIYKYFIDVIRSPITTETQQDLFQPHAFFKTIKSDSQSNQIQDVQVLIRRPLFDEYLTKDKFKTLGYIYNKIFALKFLFAASDLDTNSGSKLNTTISFFNFEKNFLSNQNMADSIILNILNQLMTNTLKVGFFTDQTNLFESQNTEEKLDSPQQLVTHAAISGIFGTLSSQTQANELTPDIFKIARIFTKNLKEDQFSLLKYGQKTNTPDSVSYYAPQNSFAGKQILRSTAKTNLILENWNTIAEKFEIQIKIRKKFEDNLNLALMQESEFNSHCDLTLDQTIIMSSKCLKFKNFFLEEKFAKSEVYNEYIKQKDNLINDFAQYLRSLNKFGIIMSTKYDNSDQGLTFEKQAKLSIDSLYYYLTNIEKTIKLFKTIPKENLEKELSSLAVITFNDNKFIQNSMQLPVFKIAMIYLNEVIKNEQITLADNSKLIATDIYRNLPSINEISKQNSHYYNVIDLLSILTKLSDSDLERTQ